MLIIEKPKLDRKTPEENMALVDRWISDTADKLNMLIRQIESERKDNAEIKN